MSNRRPSWPAVRPQLEPARLVSWLESLQLVPTLNSESAGREVYGVLYLLGRHHVADTAASFAVGDEIAGDVVLV